MAKDLILNEDNVLMIKDGDLVVGNSKFQHVKHLLESEKGYFKFSPMAGVGASNLINDELSPEELLRHIRLELERDGFVITKLLMTSEGKIDIDGDYESL